MARVVVLTDRCKSCEICIQTCPRECLRLGDQTNPAGYFAVRFEREDQCTGCGLCGEMCPDLALQVWK